MDRALVFCTAWIVGDPGRHVDWVNYYADFFRGEPVDLVVVNDGPVPDGTPGHGAELIGFPAHLGRPSLMCMPGFKRSFYTAVRTAVRRDYRWVGHVESDCWILPAGRDEFLRALFSPGHRVPWLPQSGHCESALQVINDPVSLQFFLSRYEDGAYDETGHFERTIDAQLNPVYFLKGERWNNRLNGFVHHKPDDLFIANMPYQVFGWFHDQLKAHHDKVCHVAHTDDTRDPCRDRKSGTRPPT